MLFSLLDFGTPVTEVALSSPSFHLFCIEREDRRSDLQLDFLSPFALSVFFFFFSPLSPKITFVRCVNSFYVYFFRSRQQYLSAKCLFGDFKTMGDDDVNGPLLTFDRF